MSAANLTHTLIDKSDGEDRSVITNEGASVLLWTPEKEKGKARRKSCYPEGEFDAFDERRITFLGESRTLASFLEKPKYRTYIMHEDPEFATWTYGLGVGDPQKQSINPLVRDAVFHWRQGDCIFLGASMKVYGSEDLWAKFLVGVLVLEGIYYRGMLPFPKLHQKLKNRQREENYIHEFLDYRSRTIRVAQNFHYRAEYTGPDIFILAGDRQQSQLATPPIRLSEWNTRTGALIPPFNEWDMPHFHMGSPRLKLRGTVERLLEFIRDPLHTMATYHHPDYRDGRYLLNI